MRKLGLRFLLACLLQWTGTCASAPAPREARLLQARNSTFDGQVNVTGFPTCAYANCITSDQLSPSRLGCVAAELTTDCLCNNASTPLARRSVGPRQLLVRPRGLVCRRVSRLRGARQVGDDATVHPELCLGLPGAAGLCHADAELLLHPSSPAAA